MTQREPERRQVSSVLCCLACATMWSGPLDNGGAYIGFSIAG
jgi:hypothetical protein